MNENRCLDTSANLLYVRCRDRIDFRTRQSTLGNENAWQAVDNRGELVTLFISATQYHDDTTESTDKRFTEALTAPLRTAS